VIIIFGFLAALERPVDYSGLPPQVALGLLIDTFLMVD